ncbi:Hypothetical protein CINCED_3A016460 [Cinara cedri]|uniref:Short-chain dehydrogenase/reductase 3 n=1 Tax=Cinara cedri TaxID=506608 RepID=A0A5E4NEB7_9HEMI|nr:Hypothetical protein CINCED_3A016460 [Cinara cedri]
MLKNLSSDNMLTHHEHKRNDVKVLPLAPPASQTSWMVKNPISLVLEVVLIFYMLLITLFFKIFRIILPKSKKSVNDKVVLVTGAGRGLGRELALQFAGLGAKVACVDVDPLSNEETTQFIERHIPGAKIKAYTVNVAISAETEALAARVEQDLGPVDVLINNASVIMAHSFLETTNHTITAIVNINLLGQFWMIRSFLPSMLKRNSGHIVAISSVSALSGAANLSAYTASKCGVNGMMDSLREELRERPNNQIQTTVVLPKLINTSADYLKYINSRTPVLSLERAAKRTVYAILTNKVEHSIPGYVYYANTIRKILPVNISDSIKNIFYVKYTVPPQEVQITMPNSMIINRTLSIN